MHRCHRVNEAPVSLVVVLVQYGVSGVEFAHVARGQGEHVGCRVPAKDVINRLHRQLPCHGLPHSPHATPRHSERHLGLACHPMLSRTACMPSAALLIAPFARSYCLQPQCANPSCAPRSRAFGALLQHLGAGSTAAAWWISGAGLAPAGL
jgi:hypothetical protein